MIVVTGGSGFVGHNLVQALAARLDNLKILDRRHVEPTDLLTDELDERIAGAQAVVHLAANADVRGGWEHPFKDLSENVFATHRLLESMRRVGVKRIIFASSGAVYGASPIPMREDGPIPQQTSLYGASKMAVEGFLGAYAEAGHLSVTIFRFVSMLGPGYSHGHVYDFVKKLHNDPTVLPILGDGTQRKSYLDVSDAVKAILMRLEADPGFEVLNLGIANSCTVTESAQWICDALGVKPRFEYQGGNWVGDHPVMLDTRRMRSFGWCPTYSIPEALYRTVEYLR